MSRRVFAYLMSFLALLSAASWLFFANFKIDGVDHLKVVQRNAKPTNEATGSPEKDIVAPVQQVLKSTFQASPPKSQQPPARRTVQGTRYVSVATFNMGSFNEVKARKTVVLDAYARILSRFDIVALQEIQSDTDDLIPRLTAHMSKMGHTFDYVIGPRTGPDSLTEQFAFVFNLKTIEVDRLALYTVADPDNLLRHNPLVGWFRCRRARPDQAFTFSLVNVHVDPRRVRDEVAVLRDVMFEVRNDGREEDDVIMLGTFGPNYRDYPGLATIGDIGWAIGDIPTLTEGYESLDNIAFQKLATQEFSGRSGVFDFLREYNLSLEQAREISDHMPVYGRFLIYEGGEPGRVAIKGRSAVPQ